MKRSYLPSVVKLLTILASMVIVCIIMFVVIFGIFYFEYADIPTGELFTDSTGVEWRVLTEDSNGNRLIITADVFGFPEGVKYNNTNVYSRLGDSDTLSSTLSEWFDNNLALELKEVALPAENVNNDLRSEPGGNEMWTKESGIEGLTRAGAGEATTENSLFVLSISEVNQYNRQGGFLGYDIFINRNRNWWLRSPGNDAEKPIAVITGDTKVSVWHAQATEKYGFRPALWVRRVR